MDIREKRQERDPHKITAVKTVMRGCCEVNRVATDDPDIKTPYRPGFGDVAEIKTIVNRG